MLRAAIAALLCSASLASLSLADTQGYYRQPAIHGDTIVFVSEGDLWSVPAVGGRAVRITSNPGDESSPAISPDGQTLAFTAQYEGPTEVYTMPLSGGLPTRRTFDGARASVQGWTPDGKIIATTDHFATLPNVQTTLIDLKTGERTLLQLSQCSDAAISGENNGGGQTVFFTRLPFNGSNTKRYKGGTAQNLWKYDLAAPDKEAVPLTPDYEGTSRRPMLWKDRLYFLTDRDGTMNIWSMTPDGKDLKQHTHHVGLDAGGAGGNLGASIDSEGSGRIIYQLGADLRLYDASADTDALIPITLASDLDQEREHWIKKPADYITSAHLSPDGDRLAITARGHIFVFPAKQGRIVEAGGGGRDQGVRFRNGRFLPDAAEEKPADKSDEKPTDKDTAKQDKSDKPDSADTKPDKKDQPESKPDADKNDEKKDDKAKGPSRKSHSLIALSDKSGEIELWTAPANGVGEEHQLTTDGEVIRWDVFPSPDGRFVANYDKDLRLWVYDTQAKKNTQIDSFKLDDFSEFAWSADSRYLAYVWWADNMFRQLKVWDSKTNQSTLVTTDRFDSYAPAFSPDGKWLYFLSDRNLKSIVESPWGPNQPDPFLDKTTRIYQLALQPGNRSPFAPADELHGPGAEKKKEEKPSTKPPETKPTTKPETPEPPVKPELPKKEPSEPKTPPSEPKPPKPSQPQPGGPKSEIYQPSSHTTSFQTSSSPLGSALRPEGASDGGHGWSAAEPVGSDPLASPRPEGARENSSTVQPDSPDSSPSSHSPKSDSKSPPPIDFTNITTRLELTPLPAGNYTRLFASDKALFFASFDRADPSKLTLHALPITSDNPEPKTVAPDLRDFELSADGKKLLLRKADSFFIVDAAPAPAADLDKHAVDLSGWSLSITPREEWREMFNEAWRLDRDYFYDTKMHGVDWRKVREKYAPLVERISSRAELTDILAQMIGELSALHEFAYGGDVRQPDDHVQPATLGALLTRDEKAGGYRIDRIYQADPDDPEKLSPLARPGVDCHEGDIITMIDGVPTLSIPDASALLRNKAGKQVLLHVVKGPNAAKGVPAPHADNHPAPNANTQSNDRDNKAPDDHAGEAEYNTIALPISAAADADLRYTDWELSRRQLVEKWSNGQVGYLHLRAMGGDNFTEFVRGFYPVFNRPGLIIDVRHNRGGSIDSWILSKLARKAWFFWNQRVNPQPPQWNMQYAFRGHMVTLCNERTSSDGEAFSEGFKRLDLGKVMGTRTWGGEVWLSSSNILVDKGIATAAETGVYGPEGKWLVEGRGVDPDITIDNLPHATFTGEDAQLKAAVDELLQEIKEHPIPPNTPPPLPNKSSPDNK